MLEQITREAHRVPIRLNTPLPSTPYPSTSNHPSSPPLLLSSTPPEWRLIQASSLIHVFIYYFIGCVWARERRHLVVRTVINSLKPLPLSSSLLSNPSQSLSPHLHWRGPFLPAQTHSPTAIPVLPSCLFYSTFTLFSPRSNLPSTSSFHLFHSLFHFLCFPLPCAEGQVFNYVQRQKKGGKAEADL